jgi:ribosomal protein S16
MSGWESQSAGYAAVWATENTREALWDAMMRKEVYATTGPRMTVRMFGGFDFAEADALRNDMAAVGYAKGVPMGGSLMRAPDGAAPTFLLAAATDGANLDRVQIIKGWLDTNGEVHESIYDVAVSDGRAVVDGKVSEAVGSTVDVDSATYTNSIGDALLTAWWSDPDFDPSLKAFYYARVIEIPTPRWTAYDQIRLGVKMSDEVPMVLQERAYTSPIWYTP